MARISEACVVFLWTIGSVCLSWPSRTSGGRFSRRIFNRFPSYDGYKSRAGHRQKVKPEMAKIKTISRLNEVEVPKNTCEILPITPSFRDRLRKQAYDNAVTLFFLVFCFIVTWLLLFLFNMGVLP